MHQQVKCLLRDCFAGRQTTTKASLDIKSSIKREKVQIKTQKFIKFFHDCISTFIFFVFFMRVFLVTLFTLKKSS